MLASTPDSRASTDHTEPAPTLDAGSFQGHWTTLPVSDTWTLPYASPALADQLQARMAAQHIKCMAFGGAGDQVKFYFFAQEAQTSVTLLVELILTKSTQQASATVKGTAPALVPMFSETLKRTLTS